GFQYFVQIVGQNWPRVLLVHCTLLATCLHRFDEEICYYFNVCPSHSTSASSPFNNLSRVAAGRSYQKYWCTESQGLENFACYNTLPPPPPVISTGANPHSTPRPCDRRKCLVAGHTAVQYNAVRHSKPLGLFTNMVRMLAVVMEIPIVVVAT